MDVSNILIDERNQKPKICLLEDEEEAIKNFFSYLEEIAAAMGTLEVDPNQAILKKARRGMCLYPPS